VVIEKRLRMQIYELIWSDDGMMGCVAVVIAPSADRAWELVDVAPEKRGKYKCLAGTREEAERVIAREEP
jgi:hypothetical protein